MLRESAAAAYRRFISIARLLITRPSAGQDVEVAADAERKKKVFYYNKHPCDGLLVGGW